MLNHSQVASLSQKYYKVRWNYYKLRQLSLLQSAMDRYYKLRQLFYYKVRQGLLQITTGITKCDGFITNCDSIHVTYVAKRLCDWSSWFDCFL